MSHFGIDLFGRETPPPGYHSASELWRIQNLGPPPDQLTTQTIDLSTSFKLVYPDKNSNNKLTWIPRKSKGKFLISIPAISTTFKQFREIIARKCEENSEGAGKIIQNTLESGSPGINWKVWMNLPAAHKFKKNANYKVNDIDSFTHWTATIIANGKDRTDASLEVEMISPANLEKEAKAAVKIKQHVMTHAADQRASTSKHQDPSNLVAAEDFDLYNLYRDQIFNAHPPNVQYHNKIPVFIDPGDRSRYILLTTGNVDKWAYALTKPNTAVSLHSPPPELKFEKLSASKKHKLDNCSSSRTRRVSSQSDSDGSSVINPGVNLLEAYLEFIKIPAIERSEIARILTEHKATNPRFFRSKNITRDVMKGWGLADIYIAQLRDNVKKFEKSKASE
ncbi:uncharacterized protein PGTG_03421 [Puccinia graminis f. sp. tritici CRL 75-36-700-3]|uniref:Uncharacterized protein n=1 Tax=Puccinia graminis f. sp. tritici (strain CRL 75-36-700-3 / race SCCL) TaxID=418459 RepID=E3JZJ0_PUCGT|nr:uncharacterized protein PGTG_03421 [Puccinia graminis f. sp. tritici CRL 75-36-700-3]EFP77465.1 hypothetical protein PGTG_03421 [Puccinia graminis f. sp. tritici CRL 75-36-700-3]